MSLLNKMFSFSTDSTLEMLSANEIQEAVHRTTNSEKFEADLICALNHVLGQSCHYGEMKVMREISIQYCCDVKKINIMHIAMKN